MLTALEIYFTFFLLLIFLLFEVLSNLLYRLVLLSLPIDACEEWMVFDLFIAIFTVAEAFKTLFDQKRSNEGFVMLDVFI